MDGLGHHHQIHAFQTVVNSHQWHQTFVPCGYKARPHISGYQCQMLTVSPILGVCSNHNSMILFKHHMQKSFSVI